MIAALGAITGGLTLFGLPLFALFAALTVLYSIALQQDFSLIATTLYGQFTRSPTLYTIPLFTFAGYLMAESKTGDRLVRFFSAWFGWMPGGLAVATNWACAAFGAASGSSVAAAAVMARLAVPEMLKQKYDKGLATGVCASGGTLDALIPPSISFVIYGIFAEVSVAKLLIAGIMPGILTAVCYMILIIGRCWLNPSLGPPLVVTDREALWRERWASLSQIWPILILIAGVIGGLIGFGIVGLFIGPVILAVTYTLLVAWVGDGNAPSTH